MDKTDRMRGERLSNIELLRIVSMMMVLVVHMDGASLGLPEGLGRGSDVRDVWRLGVESAVIVGVNCFTLISGYFGIRLRWRGVTAFLLQCAFYSVGIATAAWLVNPARYGLHYWLESWMVLTHTDLWYVPAYFLLMLFSPVVNAGMAALDRRENLLLAVALTVYSVWAGWLWGGAFNPTGYTVVQLLTVYVVGRVLSLYPRPSSRQAAGWWAVYAAATATVFASCSFLPVLKAFAYNSPFVLLSSVALFEAFLCMELRSRWVNLLARSAFAVYLVHKAPVVWGGFLKPFVAGCWEAMGLWEFSALVAGLAIAVYAVVVPLDAVRRRVSDLLIGLLGKCFK